MAHTIHQRLERLKELPPWEWQNEAHDWIADGLKSADPTTRELAASLAHATTDDALANELLQIVRTDSIAEVAAAAALSLGPALEECSLEYDEGLADAMPEIGSTAPFSQEVYKEISDGLKTVYHDAGRPHLVRRRVLEAAVRAPQDWHIAATRAAYNSDDPDWRLTAVFCMGFLESFDDTILEALHSDDQRIRREALISAGSREIQAAGPEVIRVAADRTSSIELRLAAITALETLDPPESENLLEKLSEDQDEEIAEAARNTLEERAVFAPLDEDDESDEDEE